MEQTKRVWGVIIWNGIGMPPKNDIRFADDKEELIEYLEENCKDGDKIWLNYGIEYNNGNSWKQNGMTTFATDYKVILIQLKRQ
jgi:hypothetical protein